MTDSVDAATSSDTKCGMTASSERAMKSTRRTGKRRLRFFVYSLIPVAVLIVTVELLVRVTGLDQPQFQTPFLTQKDDPVHRHDAQLFFELRPNLDVDMDGARVVTNSDGMRSAEIGPKQPGEYRILSLGESSTFGAFVAGHDTYSAQLQKQLRQNDGSRTWRVINAGVSAYSSFQSLKFLELRGLEFQPDLVLFYHEINDFLPATVRGGDAQDENGLAMTDLELYASKQQSLHRRLITISATYRVIHQFQLRRRLHTGNEMLGGDNAIAIPRVFYQVESRAGARLMNVPTRVPAEQRTSILQDLKTLCDEHGVKLVIIHPSYRESEQHECELTEFCKNAQVPTFDAYQSLHRDRSSPDEWYLDMWHPTAKGHQALAKDLCEFLLSSGLVP